MSISKGDYNIGGIFHLIEETLHLIFWKIINTPALTLRNTYNYLVWMDAIEWCCCWDSVHAIIVSRGENVPGMSVVV